MRASDFTRARERAAHASGVSTTLDGAGGRIRTCVAVRRRIYSPLELATLPPLRESLLRSLASWVAGRPGAGPPLTPLSGWSPRGDSNPLTYRLQIGCAAIAPLGRVQGQTRERNNRTPNPRSATIRQYKNPRSRGSTFGRRRAVRAPLNGHPRSLFSAHPERV